MNNEQLSITKKRYLKIRSLLSSVFGLFFLSCILFLVSNVFAQNSRPGRIISLSPAVSRQLFILGMEDEVIGVTTYCDVEQFSNKERIGTFLDVNLERIIAMKPDLIIATNLTDKKIIQKLSDLDINVAVFDEAGNFENLCDQFLGLAQLVGRAELGEKLVDEAKKQISRLEETALNLPHPKVIVQIGSNPLWIATEDSLINDFIQTAGGINAGPPGRNGLVSREYVIRQDPDVILIIDMGMEGEKEKEIWSKFDTVNAVKQGRIYIIGAYGICSPTPLSFVETLKELFKILHKENDVLRD